MVEVGLWGCHERTATNGGGHPRGKQFLLIQRSHPHGGAKAWWTRSWTSLLLDLPSSSPRQPVPFTNECSRSPSLALHLFLRPSRLLPPRSSPLPQNPLRLGPFIFILLILLSLSPSHSLSLSLSLSPLPLLLFQTDPFTVSPSVQSIHRRASQSIWAALGQCLPAIKK